MLDTLSSTSEYVCNSIKTFDFSTLYTTIPHAKLNLDLKNLFNVASQIRMENKDISILFIGRDKYYFIKSRSKANKKSKQNVIIQI